MKAKKQDHIKLLSTRNLLHQCQQHSQQPTQNLLEQCQLTPHQPTQSLLHQCLLPQQPAQKQFSSKSQDKLEKNLLRGG
jgi:hypothetical protein